MRSLGDNETAGFKIALRHFYQGSPDGKEITTRTITDGATLQDLRPAFGRGGLIALVGVIIEKFNGLFNFQPSKKMTFNQIEDIAAELVLDFLDRKQTPVTFEELAVFFDRASRNEFINPKTGRGFIFDRIDKSVIYEMLDFYFEDQQEGRTAAVWALQDEKERLQREALKDAETPRMAATDGLKPIEELIKGKSHLTAKGLKELHEKYGK